MQRDGAIETASVSGRVVENKKNNRVVAELRRFDIAATGLQETHWFGQESYVVDCFTILSSGRPSPGADDSRRQGEGVAIVLDRCAASAWRAGGCVWKAVSSRVVSARLQFASLMGQLRVSLWFVPTHQLTQLVAL